MIRAIFVVGFAIFAAIVAPPADREEADPYWIGLVRIELKIRSSGLNVRTSFIQKNLPKLGDCAAIALIKLISAGEIAQPDVVTASLSIIRDAFARPDLIAFNVDREPKITLCLLNLFAANVKDEEALRDVERTRSLVLKKTAK